jgi:hypothetical protein
MPCSPEPLAALTSPDPSSVSKAQTSPRQPLGEPLLPVESIHGRDLIVSSRRSMSSHPLKNEAAQKQYESAKASSREENGFYLTRAAEYIKERLSKRSPACDAFPCPLHEAWRPRVTETKAKQAGMDTVSKSTANAIEHTPCAGVAPTPLAISPTPSHPAQATFRRQPPDDPLFTEAMPRQHSLCVAINKCPSSDSHSPTAEQSSPDAVSKGMMDVIGPPTLSSFEGRHTVIDKVIRATLTTCSPRAKCLMAVHLLSSIEAAAEHEHSSERSPIKWEFVCQAPANAKSQSGCLLVKIREEGKWSSQEAISKMEESTCTHSPEPTTALTLLATSPALMQAYSHLLPSLKLGWRARCKPPNVMGTFRQRYTKVVNKQTHTSAEHSPKSPAALTPLASSPAFPQAYAHRLSILKLVWRARCKPPNVTGILR